jgi:hypothetical protein
MARMETYDWENMCLKMPHDNSMSRFVVLNNMANDVLANEELMVLSTNIPFTISYLFMGQCVYAPIAKYHTPWCMIHP